MPVNRPRRVRIRAAILILMGRSLAALNNNQDNTVWEQSDASLSKVLLMFNTTTEAGWNQAQTNVDASFDDFEGYVSTTDDPEEETVAEFLADLNAKLASAGY